MKRLYSFLSIFFVVTFLFAEEKIELIGQKATAHYDGEIEGWGDVWLKTKSYTVLANYLKYDKKSSNLHLDGEIYFFEKDLRIIRSSKGNFNIDSKIGHFEKSFLLEKKDHIWLRSETLDLNKTILSIKNGSFSSCNVNNPDWEISFTSGRYDNAHSFVEVHNALFYANGVPIFYMPYYQFATKRKSGLLTPSIGLIENEGIFYLQPIFYAPSTDWDLEFYPQIRTQRGQGIGGKYRFADSPDSRGEIELGFFSEKEDYLQKYNFVNQKHYGGKIKYKSGKIFAKNNHKDELFIDLTTFNDVEYLNTKSSQINTSKIIESKINYYYDNGDNYYGTYLKYFLNTTKTSNDETMQEIPSLQYHRFSNSIFDDRLLYSFDFKTKNYYQEKGLNATQLEFSLPLTFHFKLLNDYLNFSLSQNLYTSFINYSKQESHIKSGKFLSNFLVASLNMDLAKKYDNFFHTMNIGLFYTHPQHSTSEGHFADFIQTTSERETLNAKFSQYYYNGNGVNFLSHSIIQPYYLNDYQDRRGTLENDLVIRPTKNLIISNQIDYSHILKKLSKIETSIAYKPKFFNLELTHAYKEDNLSDPNYITAKMETKLDNRYNFFIKADYNSKYDIFKLFKVGYKMKKKCWNYTLTYQEETIPTLTDDGEKSFVKKGIFLNLELYPVGQTKFRHQREKFIDD